MIKNIEFIIDRRDIRGMDELPGILGKNFGSRMLRWFISTITVKQVLVEITLSEKEEYPFPRDGGGNFPGKSVVISVIPTGIGCETGGYAADAAPATALLASCTDYLITNPNAVNASDFIFMKDNIWYTEGYIIDQFCKGGVNLYKPYSNKVGLIIEKTSQQEFFLIL
jgi:hypothetical protein